MHDPLASQANPVLLQADLVRRLCVLEEQLANIIAQLEVFKLFQYAMTVSVLFT